MNIAAIGLLVLIIVLLYIIYSKYNRKLLIKYKDLQTCLAEYPNKPTFGDKKIIVTFTTTPNRLMSNSIDDMLKSILDQSVRVSNIYMVVPEEFLGEKYEIPDKYKKFVNVFPSAMDYGEATNIVPVLIQEKQCDTIIIAVKDYIIYGSDFIKKFLDASSDNPDCIIADHKTNPTGILLKPECYECGVIDRDKNKYSDRWFINQASNAKIIDYNRNCKS